MSKEELAPYANGLGLKLDDGQKNNYLLGFQQLPNPDSLPTNALNFQ